MKPVEIQNIPSVFPNQQSVIEQYLSTVTASVGDKIVLNCLEIPDGFYFELKRAEVLNYYLAGDWQYVPLFSWFLARVGASVTVTRGSDAPAIYDLIYGNDIDRCKVPPFSGLKLTPVEGGSQDIGNLVSAPYCIVDDAHIWIRGGCKVIAVGKITAELTDNTIWAKLQGRIVAEEYVRDYLEPETTDENMEVVPLFAYSADDMASNKTDKPYYSGIFEGMPGLIMNRSAIFRNACRGRLNFAELPYQAPKLFSDGTIKRVILDSITNK